MNGLQQLAIKIYTDSEVFDHPVDRQRYRELKVEEYTGEDRWKLIAYLSNIGKSRMTRAR